MCVSLLFFFFKQKTAYEMRISDWSSDVCSSDLVKDQLSPAAQGEPFQVPRLMTRIQGELEFADTDVFMEFHDWSLLDHSPKLGEREFAIRETARSFEIDLDGKHVTYTFADEEEQLALDVPVEGWTPEALVLWLDRQVRQPEIGRAHV